MTLMENDMSDRLHCALFANTVYVATFQVKSLLAYRQLASTNAILMKASSGLKSATWLLL